MKSTKKLLSLLLVLAMVFSLAIPVFAEGEKTATQIKTAEELVTGDYVLVASNGYAPGVLDGTWITPMKIEGTVDPATAPVWKVTVNDDGTVKLTDANGVTVAPKGGNNNGIKSGDYSWTVSVSDGMFSFAGQGEDTVKLACNTGDTNNPNYFRAYKNGTISGKPDTYPCTFALYKIGTADPTPPAGEFEGKTVILHSNDVHGAITGYANMAALAADYEAKGAKVIIADAGDFSQGSTHVSISKGLEAVNMMNAAGYNVATLGNHEFDYGYAQLTENLKSAKFDVVCCNILDADGNLVFAPSKVVDVDGVKIGFIGVNTPESQTKANPALIQGLKWLSGEDMVKAVQAEADKLAETVDVTVVLAHLGVDDSSKPNTSYDLFKGLNGVDFIIDGHSHTVMDKGNADEPIQSTGTKFKSIGVVVIDNAKKAIESNKLVEITEESAKDETVAAAAQVIIDAVNAEYGVVFAKSDVYLNGAKSFKENGVLGNRDSETNLGDLITDSMVWQVKKNLDGITVPEENIVAITNGGGIRASIKAGDITKNDVNTVLPFGNTIAVVYVTGAELLEALEASTYCTPESLGGFPQVAGIEMTVDTEKKYDANDETYPGSTYYGPKSINRVTIDSINGKAFDIEATYAVITNNFLASGGDTYYAFASASAQFDTGIPLDEALMSYITEQLKGVVGEQYAAPQGRIIFPHDHDTELRNVKDPTCTEDGYTGDKVCKLCGRTMEKGEAIEALGHDFEGGHGTCNVCGFAPFSDIADSGYCDFIVVGWLAGIINGYEDGTFRPNATVTRGQFITMLWRAIGEPEAENADLSFTDAANIPDAYKAAVAWCTENGIILGYDDGTFRHDEPISRAQMATFSYRLLVLAFGEEAIDEFNQPCGFEDAASVAAPYVDAVNVCANVGIITGFDTDNDGEGDTFYPNDTGVRGQAAAIILRLVIVIADLAGVLE